MSMSQYELGCPSNLVEVKLQVVRVQVPVPPHRHQRSPGDGNLHDSSCKKRHVFHEGESDSELVFLPKQNLLEVQAVWRTEPQ